MPIRERLTLDRIVSGCVVCLAVLGVATDPSSAPAGVFVALTFALVPLRRAWQSAKGTALRSAVLWGFIAVALGIVAQGFAMTEPLASGRPAAGYLTYLSVLATLAALISVLNARTPGGGAWAILMVLLVLVFLIPWLEGPGLGRGSGGLARLSLDSPWSIFYWLLVVAAVTNYLPTRYGGAAALLFLGFALEYAGLTRLVRSPSRLGSLWSAVPMTLAAAAWVAGGRLDGPPRVSNRFEATWFWFRDHWGVVWALRVLERFNRSAEAQGWPYRLSWHGVVPSAKGIQDHPVPSEAAEATLKGLLRRFAEPGRLEESSRIKV
jgi:hypothetical protein